MTMYLGSTINSDEEVSESFKKIVIKMYQQETKLLNWIHSQTLNRKDYNYNI